MCAALAFALLYAPGAEEKSFVAPDSKLEKIWSEGAFTEGPAQGPDGCIYFSDIGNRIMKFDPKTEKTTTYREPSGRANGLKFDAKGRLIACEGADKGGGRRLSITEKDGTVKTLVDKYFDRRLNSPNDLTIDSAGAIYFSDPRYVGEEKRELDHESVYRLDPDGSLTRVIKDVVRPNGLVVAPDGKTLYVSDHVVEPNGPRLLLAYPIGKEGKIGAVKVVYDFGKERGIDGMAVAKDGTIVATAGRNKGAGIYFISPEGEKLSFIPTPEEPTNCCFAGKDRKTLYVTAGTSLYRVNLTLAGAPTAPAR
jgi:gluconolactonase